MLKIRNKITKKKNLSKAHLKTNEINDHTHAFTGAHFHSNRHCCLSAGGGER